MIKPFTPPCLTFSKLWNKIVYRAEATKIRLLIIAICILFTTCTKQTNDQLYEQKVAFFERIDSLKQAYQLVNGRLADEDLLNRTILHFKDNNSKTHIVALIENKYGKAFWDLSMVLKDKNGTFTLATPIINSENKVTALLFGSERNKAYTFFRLIDRNTPQTHLAKHGDINATAFTQSTLYGIFNAIESNWKHIINSVPHKTQDMYAAPMSNTPVEMYVAVLTDCWTYSYTYPADSYGGVGIAIGTQCQTNAMYIDNGSNTSGSSGLGATTPVHSGGGRGGVSPMPPSSLADVKNNLQNPCFKAIADHMIHNNLQNMVTNILQNTFGIGPKINLTFAESNSIVNQNGTPVPAQTQAQYDAVNKILNVTTYIRLDQFNAAASQEFRASTLIHEIVHAYIFTHPEVLNGLTQHAYMLQNYIGGIADALQSFFPSISAQEATSLALGGLGPELVGTPAFNAALTKYGFTTNANSRDFYQFYLKLYEYGTSGTRCQ